MEPPFSPDTVIMEIIRSYEPEVVRKLFEEVDIHCFDCIVAQKDSLRTVAKLHQKDADTLISTLNERFQEKEALGEPWF